MADGKIIRVPFEAARDVPDDTELHTLSARSQLLALSQTGYLHWPTRWYRQDGAELSEADKEEIEDWASKTEDELLVETIPDVPTPYWDEDSEVDDEATAAEQTWYGEVADPTVAPDETTFVENVAIWSFTGLLAVAGAVPAALAFNTIAPKFIVAVRNGNYGNIIRLFVDGEKAAEVTDAGDDSVLEIPVVGDPDLDSHQIYFTVGDA